MREFWIELDKSMSSELKGALLDAVKDCGSAVLSDSADSSIVKSSGMRLASLSGGDITIIDESIIDEVDSLPKPICLRLVVKDRVDEGKAIRAADKGVDYIVISCPNWKVIPLENLIAKTRGSTLLMAEVGNSEEAEVALETLELGVDGIVLRTSDVDEVNSTIEVLSSFSAQESGQSKVQLVPARVTCCRQLGMGARACIDTCEIMMAGEGMLSGCSSLGLFLLQAEVQENPHVEPRPFRVNAGSISLYILIPGDKTRYLSELKTADEVLLVSRDGKSRRAIIGRIKIERRPLMLVEAEAEGDSLRTIVQNAETIRFVTRDGFKSVTDLKAGDEVLVYHQRGGRHFGTLVEEETVIER